MQAVYGKIDNFATQNPCTTNIDLRKSIKIYKNKGFALCNPHPIPKRKDFVPGLKTKVTIWTNKSRRAFRSFIMTNKAPDSWYTFGATLTIPGYPLQTHEAKRLLNLFNVFSQSMPIQFACVYRLEKQKREQLHWHLIACTDCHDPKIIEHELKTCWLKALKGIGKVEKRFRGTAKKPIPLQIDEENIKYFDYWTKWKRDIGKKTMYKHACDVDIFPTQDYGNWIRYMIDHASKKKRDQIAIGCGRHWGVLNKKAFIEDKGMTIFFEENEQDFYIILRWLTRLFTPILKDKRENALFGRTKATRQRRLARNGTTNYFSNPNTIQRMIDHVKTLH